jgi:hypothetical protein
MTQETSLKTDIIPKNYENIQKNSDLKLIKNYFSENEKTLDNNDKLIEISTVKTKKDLYNFFKTSEYIYKNNSFWIQPLWKETKDFFKKNNPFWNHAESRLFIAYKNNKPAGRIASFIDYNYCKKTGKKIGFFGFFECIDDYKVAYELFEKNKNWHQSKKTKIIYGPINGRIDVGLGFLSEGYNTEPSFNSSYSPRYYIDFVERYGMSQSKVFLEYKIDLDNITSQLFKKNTNNYNHKDIKIRSFNRIKANKDTDIFIDLLNETFITHWGFAHLSKNEIKNRFGIKQARWIIDSNLFLFAEKNNEPIGFIFSFPDYNQLLKKFNGKIEIREALYFLFNKKKINRGKLHAIGCVKKYHNNNIATLLNHQILKNMIKLGYKEAVIAPVDINNIESKKIIEKIQGRPSKKFLIFKQKINNAEEVKK